MYNKQNCLWQSIFCCFKLYAVSSQKRRITVVAELFTADFLYSYNHITAANYNLCFFIIYERAHKLKRVDII